METKGERVLSVRKALKLNQTEFGEKIGLGQHAVSHIEKGNNNLSPRNLESICQKYNVNREWLETGAGEMFKPPPEKNFLERLAEEKGLNEYEKALLESIIELPKPARQAVIDWAINFVNKLDAQEERDKEKKIAALKKSIASQQAELARLKGETPYVEDISKGTG